MIPILYLYGDIALLFLRITVGIIFVAHGKEKLKNLSQTATFFNSIKITPGVFWARLVSFVELLGGLAVTLGFFTQIAAFFLALIMIVAIFTVKRAHGLVGGYEFELLLFAALLALIFLGGGSYALDSFFGIYVAR